MTRKASVLSTRLDGRNHNAKKIILGIISFVSLIIVLVVGFNVLESLKGVTSDKQVIETINNSQNTLTGFLGWQNLFGNVKDAMWVGSILVAIVIGGVAIYSYFNPPSM